MRPFVQCLACMLLLLCGSALLAEDPPPSDQPVPYSETIEVTASRVEQPLLDAPVAVSIIDRQELEITPAGNYADLFRTLPGVNVAQTSAGDYTVRSRGATRTAENSQLVLVDGRSIYIEYSGYVIWNYVPVTLDEIEAVDVVRGPGSSVWGANAMSGVINLRTRSPKDLQGGYVTAGIGEQGWRSGSARWADALGPWSYKVSASYSKQDPWPRDNLLPNGTPIPLGFLYENEGTNQPKADLRVDRDLTSSSALSFRAGYSGTEGVFHTPLGPQSVQHGAHAKYLDLGYTRNEHHARMYWNHAGGNAVAILTGRRDSYDTHTTVIEAGSRKLIGTKHMLVYGGSARDNRFDLSLAPRDHSRRDGGVYLEDIWEITKSLEVNAGARTDYFSTLGTVVSPRLSIIFKPAANHSFRLAANRAYRAPTLLENYLELNSPNAILLGSMPFVFFTHIIGNENLDEESIDALEAGWSWQRGPLFITASVYRNTTHDLARILPTEIYTPADPPANWPLPPATVPALPKTISILNAGTVRMEGVELSVEGRFRRNLHTRVSYAYQADPEATTQLPGVPLITNQPPRHSASVSADRRADRWFAAASVTYTDRAFWTDVFDPRFYGWTDAYTLVDASFGYSVTPATQLVLSATNLLDRKINQHVFGDIIGRKTAIEVRQRF